MKSYVKFPIFHKNEANFTKTQQNKATLKTLGKIQVKFSKLCKNSVNIEKLRKISNVTLKWI